MKASSRFSIFVAAVSMLLSTQQRSLSAERPKIDDLVAALGGNDEKARVEARQLLPRQSIDAVPKLLPLVMQDNEVVWRSAFNVLADFANQVSVPGREAERAKVDRKPDDLGRADSNRSGQASRVAPAPFDCPSRHRHQPNGRTA
jgi:hypothetical protein